MLMLETGTQLFLQTNMILNFHVWNFRKEFALNAVDNL